MAQRSTIFAVDEWYHCFTRGVDKRTIFNDSTDYERFLMLMYACNNTESMHISKFGTRHGGPALITVLSSERGDQLVDVGAYCLMPNHFHVLIRERREGGISQFMQKLGTGYTMYFNKKNDRTGSLFSSRFKALHVSTDQYFQRVINYIHANPAELFEPGWKRGEVASMSRLRESLLNFQYSSLLDYEGVSRTSSVIVNTAAVLELARHRPTFDSLVDDARIYHNLMASGLECIKAGP